MEGEGDGRKKGRKGRGKGREEEGKGGEGGTCSKVLGGIDAPAVSINSSVTEELSQFISLKKTVN